MAVSAGVAQADITWSQITSPASGYLQDNYDANSTITVSGVTNGNASDYIDLDCFYGTSDNGSYQQLASDVQLNADGSFSIPNLSLSPINGYACRLRAVPYDYNYENANFHGPKLAVSAWDAATDYLVSGGPNNGSLYDYYANGTTFSSYVGWDSAGDCGPYASLNDASFQYGAEALDCMGSLYGNDSYSRSEVQVDGQNAYLPDDAYQQNPGFQPLAVNQSWNPTNGFETTQETDKLVECPAPNGYDPSTTQCPSYTTAGVQLQRTMQMIGTNQIEMTDTWSSIDGHAHTVDALYDDYSQSNPTLSECCFRYTGGASFAFPGQSGFSRYAPGDIVPGSSSAPNSVFDHTNAASPDGNPDEGYGAITFSSAPSYYVFDSNQNGGSDEFQEHQTLAVPAGGSAKLTYIYSFGDSLEQVQALSLAAQDALQSPAVRINAPHSGSKYQTKGQTKKITVSGTATAGSGITSLTVAGHSVNVGANGAWSTTVTLHRGTNTITATANDRAGLSASASINVIYAKACIVPKVKGKTLSGAKKAISYAGCRVGKVEKVTSKVMKGHAAGTKQKTGRKFKPGTKLTLYVSKG